MNAACVLKHLMKRKIVNISDKKAKDLGLKVGADVVLGLEKKNSILFKSGKIGEFYNIGSNINLNNYKIAKLLIKIANQEIKIGKNVKIKFVKDRPGHDFRYALNSNKIKNKLRWKSYTKLKKGLEKTFKWYVNNQNYYSKLKKTDITKRLGQKY